MVCLSKEPIKSLSDIDLDLIDCQIPIVNLELILWHVYVERFQVLFDISDLLMKVKLLMVEFYIVVVAYVCHKALNELFIAIHLLPKLVLLADIVLTSFIKSLVISFEEGLNLGLVLVKLLQRLLLLGHIAVLKFDDFFLQLVACLS